MELSLTIIKLRFVKPTSYIDKISDHVGAKLVGYDVDAKLKELKCKLGYLITRMNVIELHEILNNIDKYFSHVF